MPEASDQEEGLRRRQGIGVANLREEFEGRYGPLWSGASSLSIEGVPHELHEVIHRLGFGFEGIKIIDAPAVEAGRHPLLRR